MCVLSENQDSSDSPDMKLPAAAAAAAQSSRHVSDLVTSGNLKYGAFIWSRLVTVR